MMVSSNKLAIDISLGHSEVGKYGLIDLAQRRKKSPRLRGVSDS